ncbi:MAG: WD40 repeat domain-containing protein [Planctomycetota bacterium]
MLASIFVVTLTACIQDPMSLAHEAYRAQMAAAEASFRLGESVEAREWLDRTAPPQRGLEWRLFHAGFDNSLTAVEVESTPLSLVTAPTGDLFAVGDSKGGLELRSTADSSLLRAVDAHTDGITQIAFDATGQRLVTASYDRKVKVWTTADLSLVLEFTGHRYPVGGAVFTADGSQIASAAYDIENGSVVGIVLVWSVADGTVARTLRGGAKPLTALALSPDGETLAAASWDFCLFVWPIAGGEPRALKIPDEGVYNGVDAVAFSADGKFLAAGVRDHTARIFATASGELVATLRAHSDSVSEVAFADHGRAVVTASRDGSLEIWDVPSFERRATLRGHAAAAQAVTFLPGGRRILSCGADRKLLTWDAETTWYSGLRMTAPIASYVVRFDPAGHRLATASYDGKVTVWSADTLERLAAWQAHPSDKSCHALAWSPDGARLYSGSYDGTVRVTDSVTGAEITRLLHDGGLYWLEASPNGERVATVSGNAAFVWDTATFQRVAELRGHEKGLLSVQWSSDSTRCVTTARDGHVRVFDATSGLEALAIAAGIPDVAEARFLDSDREIVIATRNGRVTAHDAGDGRWLRDILQPRHGLDHFAVTSDGRRIVLASAAVTFVDPKNGGIVGRFRPHVDRPYHVDIDPRGDRIASVSTDASIVLLESRPLRERLAECDQLQRMRGQCATELEKRIDRGDSAVAVLAEQRRRPTGTPLEQAAWLEVLTLHFAR